MNPSALRILATLGLAWVACNCSRQKDQTTAIDTRRSADVPNPGMHLYVSPSGSDTNDGHTTHSPFQSITRARDEVRALKTANLLPKGGVAVEIGGGEYSLAESLEFGPQDSGTLDAPVYYRAFGKDAVVIHGARSIRTSELTPVTDPQLLNRIDPTVRGKVLGASIDALGLKHAGPFPEKFDDSGDIPGEWAIDFATRTLLLLPPEAEVELRVSQLEKPLINLNGAAHLKFIGLTFDTSLGHGVVIEASESNEIAGCTFRNLAEFGVIIDGYRSGVRSSDMHDLGEGPVLGIDDRGESRGYATNPRLIKPVLAVQPNQQPWSTRFPEMATLLKMNAVNKSDPALFSESGNYVTSIDPGFTDLANGNFTLRPDSEVFTKIPGFEPIPFDQIGLFKDAYRTGIPTSEAIRRPRGNPMLEQNPNKHFGTL